MIETPLPTLAATADLAGRLAGRLRAGDVIALHGGLGAGKTTFARALISALRRQETDVPSPTYTLVQAYDGPDFPIYHFDLYRIENHDEINELGWDDTHDGLTLIEWPGNAGAYLPQWRLDLTFDNTQETRIARLEPRGEDWHKRLHGF